MTTLLDNVLAQREQIRLMGRSPKALRCDAVSFDCLMAEVLRRAPIYPAPSLGQATIYGLAIEITQEPNFEVVY